MASSYGNGHSRPDGSHPVALLDFEHGNGVYTACSESGREWRIAEERTGWRLEFRDPGDRTATNAGVHRTVEAAMAEARR
jgi:hypothetical protein